MDYHPMNPDDLSSASAEPASSELDQRLTRALEAAPDVRIPADFAARVASRVPARPIVASTPTHYGDYASLLGVLVTLAAMFWLGINTHTGPAFSFVESFLLAEFIALTLWLSIRRHRLR
jgi:hypothetical protein